MVPVESVLSGVAERPVTADIISLARRTSPPRLRTLDAIHLATAIVLDVDEAVVYDERLIQVWRRNGLTTVTPGRWCPQTELAGAPPYNSGRAEVRCAAENGLCRVRNALGRARKTGKSIDREHLRNVH